MHISGRWSDTLRVVDRRTSTTPTREQVRSDAPTSLDSASGTRTVTFRSSATSWWKPLAELALIALWAVIVGSPYLDFDEHMMPGGGEYWVNVTANTFWERFEHCGSCALWNGTMRGGYPAIADMQAAFLHPIVALPALAMGWVNGAKVTIILSLFLAGFAQWWLARVFRLGIAARLWSGCLAATAGSMTGRMEDGSVILLVSAASCALILPPFFQMARDGKRRTAAILGLTIGLALVSGQAYLQVATAAIAPCLFLVIAYRNPLGMNLLVRCYALACVIGLLIASPLLLPYLHALPDQTKDLDPTLGHGQPLAFIPLNLVIDDADFFRQPVLGKSPFPYIHTAYIGWVAVALAIAGVVALWLRKEFQLLIALAIAIVLPFWFASAVPLRWLASVMQDTRTIYEFIIGFRSLSLFGGLAVPPILGLAAIGLDWLWKSLPRGFWVALDRRDSMPGFRIDPRWLLVVLLVITTNRARDFGQHWMYVLPDGSAEMAPVLDALVTDDLQWVNTPYGFQQWWGPAIQRGLKLTISPAAWSWEPRTLPVPVLMAEYANVTPAPGVDFIEQGVLGDVVMYAAPPGNEYAAIVHPDGTRTVCSAHGLGGSIDVTCDSPQAGQLVVIERMTSDWNATVNGTPQEVSKSDVWLAVDVPAGRTTIALRYQPWDVPVGIALMAAGLILIGGAMWIDRRREPERGVWPVRNPIDRQPPGVAPA